MQVQELTPTDVCALVSRSSALSQCSHVMFVPVYLCWVGGYFKRVDPSFVGNGGGGGTGEWEPKP